MPRCRQGQADRFVTPAAITLPAAARLPPHCRCQAAAAVLPLRRCRATAAPTGCHRAAAAATTLPLPPTPRSHCHQRRAAAKMPPLLPLFSFVAVILANFVTKRLEDSHNKLLGIGYWHPWHNNESGNNLE
jgi:hypothetical protein